MKHDSKSSAPRSGLSNIVWVIIAFFILMLLFTLFPNMKARMDYNKAAKMVDAGEYQSALDMFHELEHLHFKDTDAYIHYCSAHLQFDQGDLEGAGENMIWASFSYLSPEREAAVDQFRQQLSDKLLP